MCISMSMCVYVCFLTLRVRFGEVFSRYEVHDAGFAGGEAQGTQRHIAVQEPPLVDEAEDFCFAHTLINPL